MSLHPIREATELLSLCPSKQTLELQKSFDAKDLPLRLDDRVDEFLVDFQENMVALMMHKELHRLKRELPSVFLCFDAIQSWLETKPDLRTVQGMIFSSEWSALRSIARVALSEIEQFRKKETISFS
ncbi:hypothetical protein [uncultured Erythrobacter sp.]|uniref:hypothetical protein n=1 Tax=uncultured Erythrobacter sp. TaxID=263913 RepID=UPI00260C0669|nr:hypothetical protein [uncultured Erythrobacter sp.]